MQIFQLLRSGIYAEGHEGLTLRAQRWWERRGLTQSGGGAEGAGWLVWRAQRVACLEERRGALR